MASSAVSAAEGKSPTTPTNRWSLRTRSYSQSVPAIGVDGTIYATSFDGNLHAFSASGFKKWSYRPRIPVEIHSSPAIANDGTVYFGCRDRNFYAVNPEGKLKWSFRTGGWVDSSAAIAQDGTSYVGSWDHHLYALAPDGTRKWAFDTGAPVVCSPVITTNGSICFGSHSGRYYALSAEGRVIWQYDAGGAILSSTAISATGVLYFTSVNGFLHAVNPDGSERWRLKTGSITRSSPVIASDGALYVGVNRELWCVSADGKQIWGRGNESPVEAPPVALENLSVAYLHSWGVVLCLDRQRNGLWAMEAGGGEAGVACSTNGVVYGFQGHDFFARGPVLPLARSSWPTFRGNLRNTGNAADGGGA